MRKKYKHKDRLTIYISKEASQDVLDWLGQQNSVSYSIMSILERFVKSGFTYGENNIPIADVPDLKNASINKSNNNIAIESDKPVKEESIGDKKEVKTNPATKEKQKEEISELANQNQRHKQAERNIPLSSQGGFKHSKKQKVKNEENGEYNKKQIKSIFDEN